MKKIILISLMNSVFFFSFFAGALETSKALKKDYDEFKKEMSVKMDNLELKIAALKESAKVKADEAQTKALADLEHSRDIVREDLNKLETEIPTKTKSNWRKLKSKMATAIDRLNNKAQELLKKE